MNITAKYKEQLNKVRQDLSLLDNYKFLSSDNSKHFERLRLNIALYNDLQQPDYEIVRFLFNEECKWRENPQDGEVDNLYFSAFILTRFNNPEIVWQFFDTKNIDFDSGIGFDGEYLVSTGINETYDFISNSENPLKSKLLDYIGETIEKCNFTQDDINEWIDFKKDYFKCYTYPIEDEIYFLYTTNEKELFLKKFPDWIASTSDWNYNNLSLFKTYADYSQNVDFRIKAHKRAIEKGDSQYIHIDKIKLSKIYIENKDFSTAIETLNSVLVTTNNVNINRDCIEQFCLIILNSDNIDDNFIAESTKVISRYKKKFKEFSPNVNELIVEANEKTGGQIITAHNKKYRSLGRLFKFGK